MNKCDKCRKAVEEKDDARHLWILAGFDNPAVTLWGAPRHIRCSPSRAQYIVTAGFEPVVDDRVYDKRTRDPEEVKQTELDVTRAYWMLQLGIDIATTEEE